jgi:hypothetical protein
MEKKAPFNVFVSSTYRDLKEEREKVIEAVEKVCKAIGMEKFLPDEKSTLEVCLGNLKKCDIYIGIIGLRYGSIVPENQLKEVEGKNYEKYKGLSFTHYEFRKAGELRIPRAVFIVNEETILKEVKDSISSANSLNEAMEKAKSSLKANELIAEVKASVSPVYFSNLDELDEKVGNFLKERIPEWTLKGTLKIPGFYGREGELRELYEKIIDEKQVCSIVNVFGIGGIGKTAFVEALLLLLSIKGYLVWEVRSAEGRETTFYTPENYKNGVLEFPNIRGLVQLLGIEVKENIEDSLINWLNDNKVILFIDDFQKLESDFKDFINKAYNKLRNGKIIIASRGRANVRCHLSKELLELEEESCKEMIRSELEKASFEPNEEVVNLIYEKIKGYPLAVKMLVLLISKYKLSFDELRNFGSISNVQDEKEVKEFISRVFLENVKDERDCNVFKYVSLLKDGFDYSILRAILKVLKDERYEWEGEKLLREFLSRFMPHIISYDDKRKIFNFSNDMIKEAAYSRVENVEEAREKLLEVLEEMDEKLSDEKKAFVNEEIVYQAEEITKHKGENEELIKLAFESSIMLADYYRYSKNIPLMTYEYGKKALYYAEKLEAWIEALRMAEHALFYAYKLLIPEEEARTLYSKVNEVFPKALKLNEEMARHYYAFTMKNWADYALDLLNDDEEADSSLEKAFKEVGSKYSRLIKDELSWCDAYSALLTIKSDLLSYKGDLKEALGLLKEEEELLEYYKDKIINRWGEKKYYENKSVIMDRLGKLTFDTTKSEDDLKKAKEYVKNSITYSLNSENRLNAVTGRINLARIQMMLAKNQDNFRKANEKVEGINLEDCIKIFEEIGDKNDEAFAKNYMAICCLALKNDEDALKFAKDSIEIAKNGPDEYLKAYAELTLAYIMMTSRLSDFKKGKLSDEVYELIQDAYEKFEKIRVTSRFITLAVEVIAKYLQNKVNYDELIKELDELAKELENIEDKRRAWIVKQLIDAIKKKGDIDEDLLRLEGVKLLLA